MLNEKMVKTLFAIVTPPVFVKCSAHSQMLGPSNLTSALNEKTIKLKWGAAKSEDLIIYNIYRAKVNISGNSLHSGVIDFIKINSVSSTNYFDEIGNFDSGYIFIYYVTAVYMDGTESSPSNYIKVIMDGFKIDLIEGSMQN